MGTWTHTGYAQQIHFGDGSVARLPELLRTVDAKRVLLVSTSGRLESPDGTKVATLIGRYLAATFDEVTSHVPTPIVQAAVQRARREAVDAVVSFGGGSCADTAKAVTFFVEQEQGAPGSSFADRPLVPHVAIPTTYSGAELTPFFGMTDPHTRQKGGGGGPTTAPMAAIYDPELTRSTPAEVSAQTGMNALAHCVEVLWSTTSTPEARSIAQAGARQISVALPWVVEEPDDLAARNAMLEGAVLGGRCLQNGAMGIHHGLCHLIGGRTGMPHGLANAIVLPYAVRFNADAVPDAMAALGEAMGTSSDGVADQITSLVERLGLPTRLSDAGFTDEDLEVVARLSQGNGHIKNNPKPASEDDVRGLLESAF